MKLASQRWSSTCLMPTVWPAKTWLRLIFLPIEADAAARGDGDGLVMERVVELGQAAIGAG